jgi:endonuclease/exonuclease/phosphatase family metal-dependent hydrolase
VVLVRTPRDRQLLVVCTHLVSRAFTHVEASTPLRRSLWHQAAQVVRSVVRRWTSHGVPVLVLGDLNHPAPVRWAAHQVTLADVGLLQAALVPPEGWQAARGHARTLWDVHTDHPLLRRVARLDRVASGP